MTKLEHINYVTKMRKQFERHSFNSLMLY